MEGKEWGFEPWDLIPVVFFGLLGVLWGLLAIWAVFTWNLPVPALDLAGMASAVLLWPFWATWLLSGVLARTGWTIGTEVWFFPEVLGALAGLGGGLLLLIRSRR